DPASLERAIATARRHDLRVRAVIPVDLFGQPADYRAIEPIARAANMFVLADAAQSFGASCRNRAVGTLADATATSFFPAKPLGVYGDGGAVCTDDDELAEVIRTLRVHGERERHDCVRLGLNGRFDTIQAAVLIEKLKIFREEIAARERIARRYSAALADVAAVPHLADGMTSVWAQYTIRLPGARRDGFVSTLKTQGIPTAIHYPRAGHRQGPPPGVPGGGRGRPPGGAGPRVGGLPGSERLWEEVVSLPMHAYLDEPNQDRIVDTVRRALGG